jgi:hypothetical protein
VLLLNECLLLLFISLSAQSGNFWIYRRNVLVYSRQNRGEVRHIRIASKFFENVTKFEKFLRVLGNNK